MMTRSELRSMPVIQAESPKAALMLGVGAPTRVAHSPSNTLGPVRGRVS